MSEARPALLDGVRVVEFSQLIAAPFCGLTLLDLGAEVIKVEPPAGDPLRGFPPYLDDGVSAQFHAMNRGKRGVVADLGDPDGRALAQSLLEEADVVVENMGDARGQLGVSFDELVARRARLVWCAITGWGVDAPGRSIDPSLQAAMGLISITGEETGGPVRIPVPLIDFMTGMYAAQSVIAAVWRVTLHGSGAFLDCAMADAAATLASTSALMAAGGYFRPRRLGSESPLVVPSGVFVASDGKQIQVVCVTERHWRALCEALGRPEWIDDPVCADNQARLANREQVHARVASVIASETAAEWVQRISSRGAICEHIRDIEEAWTDERLLARGLVAQAPDAAPWAARMPLVSLVNAGVASREPLRPAPALGADTELVARQLSARARREHRGARAGNR